MSVKYRPSAPPLLSTPDAQKLGQYIYGEMLRISQSLEGASPAPHAVCKYNGASTGTVLYAAGVSGVTKVSTGVYDVTLSQPLASLTEAYGSVISQTAAQCLAEIDAASSTTTNIRVKLVTSTSGSAVDGQFILVIYG